MTISLLRRIGLPFRSAVRRVTPVEGYDQWAATYDRQPNNVVFALESGLFSEMLARIPIEGSIVADIGCGTGRHWPEILSRGPAELIGIDPSEGMLERLKWCYPAARTICSAGDHLSEIADASCHAVVSTLALAHIPDAAGAINEWSRILRRGGSILLTDFHPDAIRSGMKRTFVSGPRTLEIEHHVTELQRLRDIAAACGLTVDFMGERVIDESVRPLYEREKYLEAYEKYKRVPLVFGLCFAKPS
jgi:ubiquinone/menaquinone biosynthesis C-methylase UbiE